MGKNVYEFEIKADSVFIDALNESLSELMKDEDSDWSFHHVKLNSQNLFLSTWDYAGKDLQHLLKVSAQHPLSVIVSNMVSRAVDDNTDDEFIGVSSVIVNGKIVSENFISSEDECYRFDDHQHSFTKDSGYNVPSDACVNSHYGYLFHFADKDTGHQFVFSRKLTANEGWHDYWGSEHLIADDPKADFSNLTGKAFMAFADSEAEMLLLETRERARIGQFMLHPVCKELNVKVLHQIFPTDEEYEQAEAGNGIFWEVHQFFQTLPQNKWNDMVISISELLEHDHIANGG